MLFRVKVKEDVVLPEKSEVAETVVALLREQEAGEQDE